MNSHIFFNEHMIIFAMLCVPCIIFLVLRILRQPYLVDDIVVVGAWCKEGKQTCTLIIVIIDIKVVVMAILLKRVNIKIHKAESNEIALTSQ